MVRAGLRVEDSEKDVADAIERRVREQSGVVANAMLSTLEEAEEAEAAE